MTIYAYLRVSLENLKTDNQRTAIIDAGFAIDEFICEEGVSGSVKAMDRPEFVRMMGKAKEGDTVVCTMIDRLGRTASDVLNTIEEFKRLGIRVVVMQFGGVDVTSSMGKMVVTVMAACAELERNLMIERTVAGMKRTKDAGTKLGPPLKITPDTLEEIVKEKALGFSVDQISIRRKLPVATVYQNLKRWGKDLGAYRMEYQARANQYSSKQMKFNAQ